MFLGIDPSPKVQRASRTRFTSASLSDRSSFQSNPCGSFSTALGCRVIVVDWIGISGMCQVSQFARLVVAQAVRRAAA
jgi:hypothetical protein